MKKMFLSKISIMALIIFGTLINLATIAFGQQSFTMNASSVSPAAIALPGGSASFSIAVSLAADPNGEGAKENVTYQSYSVKTMDGTITSINANGTYTTSIKHYADGDVGYIYTTASVPNTGLSATINVNVTYANDSIPGDKPITFSGTAIANGNTLTATTTPSNLQMHIFGGSYTLTPQWQNALQNGDMLLTCDGTATTVTCMAQTQPSGTTYQWSLTANGNEVSLSNTTSNSTTVSPVSASSSMGEIVLRLTYSLLGYTAQSNQTLTVHEPARPPSSRTTSAVQTWQGIACQYPQSDPFSSDIIKYGNQHIQVCWMTNLYTVKSKAGMLLPGILWHETNTVQCIQGDGYTDSNGQILDCLQYPVIPNFPGGSDTSSNIRYTNIHKIWLSGCGPLWNSTETVYNTPDIVQVLNN